MAKVNECGHSERKHYAYSKCRKCYELWRRTTHPKGKKAKCHRDRALYARGKCYNCYVAHIQKKCRRKTRYGLTLENYEQMLAEQGGKCAICRVRTATDVDHCHNSKKVRGVLCSRCNLGIGNLRDNPAIVERALEYLRKAA